METDSNTAKITADLRVDIVDVTPEIATAWLENNPGNRRVSDALVARYAADMRAGRWSASGNTISRAPDGTLLNGQHRLWAIVESGVTVRFVVVTEEEENRHIFDVGKTRTVADLLRMDGVQYGAIKQGICRYTLMYERQSITGVKNLWSPKVYTREEQRRWIIEHDEKLDSLVLHAREFGEEFHKGYVWYAAALWIIAENTAHLDKLQEFHSTVVEGANLSAGDPRLALRRLVTKNPTPTGLPENQLRIGAVILAWNKWIEGKEVTMVRFGRNQLPVPKPL